MSKSDTSPDEEAIASIKAGVDNLIRWAEEVASSATWRNSKPMEVERE